MGLIDAIERVEVAIGWSWGDGLDPLPASKVREVGRRLKEKFPETGSPPTQEEIGALVKRFLRALATDDWTGISRRDWRRIPWGLWTGTPPLIENEAFVTRLLERLRSETGRSGWRALIGAYLRDFDRGGRGRDRIAAALDGEVGKWDWAWKERNARFRLFDPSSAPERIAVACLSATGTVRDALSSAGLDSPMLAQGRGLERAAYALALKRLRNGALAGDGDRPFERIMEWSLVGGGLRFPRDKRNLVDALLLPWTGQDPPEDLKKEIEAFLVAQFQDPRLHPEDWHEMSDEARWIMHRWLTRTALEQYLQIVDRVTTEEKAKNMWKYRRAFWHAYFEREYLHEAWVVFAPNGATLAEQVFGETAQFGKLLGKGQIQPDHAVLLMKIGTLTIADWSHDGRCFIWDSDNPAAPKLYAESYSRSDVVTGSDNGGLIHAWAVTGSWQRKVADFIRNRTGISLSENDYMPEGWDRYA